MRVPAAALAALALLAAAAPAQEGPGGGGGPPPRAEPPVPKPKDLPLRTSDGLTLAAELTEPEGGGEGKPAVLALHHAGGDRTAWRAAAAVLASHGVSVLAVDLRGHGGSRMQGGEDLGPLAAAGDAALWKAAAADVAAGLAYLRGSLLADGKALGVAGLGAGAGLALVTVQGDPALRAVLCVEPLPNACGLGGASAAGRWDGRPAGAILTEACEKGEAGYALKGLRKQPRTEVVVLPGDGRSDAAAFAGDGRVAAEAAQFFAGWFFRPRLTGKPEEGVSRGGGIFAGGSSLSSGTVAGGLRYHGYEAPGRVGGLQLLVDPDPKAKRLTESSLRLLITPGKGKEPTLAVARERWNGKAWKKEEPLALSECGGFVVEGKTTFFDVWLPPSALGVPPFTTVAVNVQPIVDGMPKRPISIGGVASPGNPSTWDRWELR